MRFSQRHHMKSYFPATGGQNGWKMGVLKTVGVGKIALILAAIPGFDCPLVDPLSMSLCISRPSFKENPWVVTEKTTGEHNM